MRPHRRALSRQGDGGRAREGAVPVAAASLHAGAARGVAAARSRRAARAPPAAGRHSEPGRSPVRLRVPHPLPPRAGRLRRDGAAAARSRAGPTSRPACATTCDEPHAEHRSDPHRELLDAADQGLSAAARRRCRCAAVGAQRWHLLARRPAVSAGRDPRRPRSRTTTRGCATSPRRPACCWRRTARRRWRRRSSRSSSPPAHGASPSPPSSSSPYACASASAASSWRTSCSAPPRSLR